MALAQKHRTHLVTAAEECALLAEPPRDTNRLAAACRFSYFPRPVRCCCRFVNRFRLLLLVMVRMACVAIQIREDDAADEPSGPSPLSSAPAASRIQPDLDGRLDVRPAALGLRGASGVELRCGGGVAAPALQLRTVLARPVLLQKTVGARMAFAWSARILSYTFRRVIFPCDANSFVVRERIPSWLLVYSRSWFCWQSCVKIANRV